MVSIVLAAHNEEGFLTTTVGHLLDGLRARGADFEIIVAENGSTDGTREVAARLAADAPEVRALSLPDPDYGAALRAGLLDARGKTVVNFHRQSEIKTTPPPLSTHSQSKAVRPSGSRISPAKTLPAHTYSALPRHHLSLP